MNQLHIGNIDIRHPKGSFFLIHDEVPKHPKAKYFDWREHSINILDGMNEDKAVLFVEAIKALMPGGENTLTKEDAESVLLKALMSKPQSLETLIEKSKDPVREKARRMVERLLFSPKVRNVLCKPTNFSLHGRNRKVFARINRAELGRFNARALVWLLMAQYDGQFVIPNYAPYAHDSHVDFIEQNRMMIGVRWLDQLTRKAPDMRDAVMQIPEKIVRSVTPKDAQELANYMEKNPPHTDGYDTFIKAAIA